MSKVAERFEVSVEDLTSRAATAVLYFRDSSPCT